MRASGKSRTLADMNADFRDGHGSLPMSSTTTRRAATSMAYLDAAVRARSNLAIMAGASVTKFLFEDRKVTGVSVMVDGAEKEIRAGEVIVAGGAIASPALLLRPALDPPTSCGHSASISSPTCARRPQSAEPSVAVSGGAFAPRHAAAAESAGRIR